jgi:hypothetical protein
MCMSRSVFIHKLSWFVIIDLRLLSRISAYICNISWLSSIFRSQTQYGCLWFSLLYPFSSHIWVKCRWLVHGQHEEIRKIMLRESKFWMLCHFLQVSLWCEMPSTAEVRWRRVMVECKLTGSPDPFCIFHVVIIRCSRTSEWKVRSLWK